jgi:hypothetical protein
MISVIVEDKKRIVRNKYIEYFTENDLYCTYKNYSIAISRTDVDDFYIDVRDKTGMVAIQGGFGGHYCRYNIKTLEDCLKLCIENILI